MGLSDDRNYARYHQVLNRAVWSPRQAAGILLVLLLQHLDQGDGPLIFGIDETLERRRGPKSNPWASTATGCAPAGPQVVKASGLRWISLMWLGQVPWAGRYWPCPFSLCWRPRHATTGSADAAIKTHRLGPADDPATAPLAAAASPGAGGRRRLRRPRPAPLLPIVGATRYAHRPLAPGRRPL